MSEKIGLAAGPARIVQPFEFKSVNQLLDGAEESVGYCIEGLLPSGGTSALIAKPKVGKSTYARQAGAAVAQGKTFLDRQTEQGPVLYLAIEEKRAEIAEHFRQLGIAASDPLFTICGAVRKTEAIAKLEASLIAYPGTKLVIIDTIFRFVGVKDSNDYIQVNNALEQVQELARKYGPHILMVHHMKKKETEDMMDGALGSTAIAGAVDTYISLKADGRGQRTVCTRQRYGTDMPETLLNWDADARTLSLGQTRDEADEESAHATEKRIGRETLSYVAAHPGCTQEAILDSVRGKKTSKLRVLQSLLDNENLMRSGEGVKGAPHMYSLPEIPTEHQSMVEPTIEL